MIYIHKLTGQRMMLKKKGESVSSLYILDGNGEKIQENGIASKQPMLDVKGNPAYKTAICSNENLKEVIYKEENGMRVAEEGFVIIEGEEHFVKGGFVACNRALNGIAWNTTKKEKTCNQCARFKRGGQLELF